MGKWLLLCVLALKGASLGAFEEYWLIQEDFIKFGKKDAYKAQKQVEMLQKEVGVSLEDLENPQYIFLRPLKKLAALESLPPFSQEKPDALLANCLNFQIFSLHRFLKKCSFKEEETFLRPYVFYALYEVFPGQEALFEEHVAKGAENLAKTNLSGIVWQSLLAGDVPKYLLCLSFASKKDMEEWSMEKWVDEPLLKDVLRGRKIGRLKKAF